MSIKNKIILTIVLLSLLIILFVIFLISPLFNGIKKSSKELFSQRENLASLDARVNSLEKLRAVYDDFESNSQKIDDLFVNSEMPVDFIGFLEEVAADSKINIKIFPAPPGKSEKDAWPSFVFQINAEGNFSNFLIFLEKLENSPYLIEIQNLNIGKFKEAGFIQSLFSLKVYTR